ncbi:MAG: flagellar biosynthetic protein FliO [Burkholderiales bacterium]|nr:flagellar biosynthetic protein FliO [Burkholderiales bacterium]
MKIQNRQLTFFFSLMAPGTGSMAADSAAISPGSGLLQIAFGLFVVLGLMAFAAWIMKRLGPVAGGNKLAVKVVGGVNVGNRERIMVVEVADQWLVLGVTAGNITTLTTLPKQDDFLQQAAHPPMAGQFSMWLKRTMDKRKLDSTETK